MRALVRVGPAVGMIGSALFVLASVVSAAAYSGTLGEAYSPLNHWVSELGEIGVSQLAAVFNAGLVIGGLSLAVFMSALGLVHGGRLAWLYVPVSIIAGVSGALVGVFPMNQIDIHRLVALGFFNLGWICVGLASIAIWRRPDARFARWLPLLGAVTVVLFIGFLAVYIPLLTYPDTDASRPAMSVATTLEWLVLAGIIGWVLAASLSWWRYARGAGD
jgi:hypothetical membrane protein